MMKTSLQSVQLACGALALLMLGGCELVGNIFEAGMWFGIIIIVLIVAAVIWLMGRFRRRD